VLVLSEDGLPEVPDQHQIVAHLAAGVQDAALVRGHREPKEILWGVKLAEFDISSGCGFDEVQHWIRCRPAGDVVQPFGCETESSLTHTGELPPWRPTGERERQERAVTESGAVEQRLSIEGLGRVVTAAASRDAFFPPPDAGIRQMSRRPARTAV